jgi:hypothetical protein
MRSRQDEEKFNEAKQSWNLEKLYADLTDAKQRYLTGNQRKLLTSIEKCYLRGLLCGLSPEQISAARGKAMGTAVDALSKGLYRYIEELLRHQTNESLQIRWDNIPHLLEKAGYKKELVEQFPAKKDYDSSSTIVGDGELELGESKFPEAQVVLDSVFYIERPPIESICYETLLQPGSLLRIKAPQQMGKTSLITRVLAQLAKKEYRTVRLSFKQADRIHFTNLDEFLRFFCDSVSRELGLPSQVVYHWNQETTGSKVKCTNYFEEYLLNEVYSPLALCVDDVDLVFPYPEIYEDFFALLRFWHERAKNRSIWKKLRLVVVHSTEVYIQLDINQSPFNVGEQIELPEFTREQVQDFAQQYGLDWDASQAEKLMEMVGGHPYLVRKFVSHLKNHSEVTLDQLLEMAPTDAGIYRNHLRQHLLSLKQRPKLDEALKKVVTATSSVRLESTQAYKLLSMGLVKLESNDVQPRCNLYRQYFCNLIEDT